jgi:hypothetical protein
LATELSKAASIDSDRIKAVYNKYQIDQLDGEKQVVLKFSISATDDSFKPNVNAIMNDLDTLIKYKSYTPISLYNNTYMLDSEYGLQETCKLKIFLYFSSLNYTKFNFFSKKVDYLDKYKIIFILVLIFILMALIITSAVLYYKFKRKENFKQMLDKFKKIFKIIYILKVILIIGDFIMDSIFASYDSKKIEYLQIPRY